VFSVSCQHFEQEPRDGILVFPTAPLVGVRNSQLYTLLAVQTKLHIRHECGECNKKIMF
jgi:hypothetical protein